MLLLESSRNHGLNHLKESKQANKDFFLQPTNAEIKLLPDIHGITDVNVWLSQRLAGSPDGSGSNLREPSAEHLNVLLD